MVDKNRIEFVLIGLIHDIAYHIAVSVFYLTTRPPVPDRVKSYFR